MKVPKDPSTQIPEGNTQEGGANSQVPKDPNTQGAEGNTQIPEYPSTQGECSVVMESRLTGSGKPYDLGERTALFGEAVIDFLKRTSRNACKRHVNPMFPRPPRWATFRPNETVGGARWDRGRQRSGIVSG